MNKAISALLVLVVALSLCACGNEETKYLTQSEASDKLIDVAEPELAEAIGIFPTSLFKMDRYNITEATHYEELGYWYFEIEGTIPMYDEGLYVINFNFDARVNNTTGEATLGTLTIDGLQSN